MSVSLETFVKELTDSGIIAPGKLENFIPPKASPKDAEELAQQLLQGNQLTKYQIQEVNHGRGKSLSLGGYTILDKIGAGGMGQVFKALHRKMDRTVAIKMLPSAMMADAASLARFEREVRAAAKLSHPNIVAAHDADEATVAALRVLEPDTRGLARLLSAFYGMVERQLAHPKNENGWRRNAARNGDSRNIPSALLGELDHIVVAYGESVADDYGGKRAARVPVYWTAQRLGTGERFACTIQPPAPLQSSLLGHWELTEEHFAHALPLAEVARSGLCFSVQAIF